MRAQWELQRQILPRARALGIKAILPAFQGSNKNKKNKKKESRHLMVFKKLPCTSAELLTMPRLLAT